jgi:transcriptional regulator with XRE-family HTH domain
MAYGLSPAVQRRRLRTELRRGRENAELTQEQAAKALDWSLSKLIRIEAGRVGLSTTDLRALLDLYKVTDSEKIANLVSLAKGARERSWWSAYRDKLPQRYLQYIQYEESASNIRSFEPLLVPGLLQTKDYASAIIKSPGIFSATAVGARIEARMIRQRILDQGDPPSMSFIMDEAVISRLVGEKTVAPDQLSRLIDLAGRPNITLQILPFSAGLYKGTMDTFVLLQFPDPEDSDVLFIESRADMIFTRDDAGEIELYQARFSSLESISLGPNDSLDYLRDVARKL